jgi:hypothetical protein
MSTEGETLQVPVLPARYVLNAVSVLVVAQPISDVPEGLTNCPVYMYIMLM